MLNKSLSKLLYLSTQNTLQKQRQVRYMFTRMQHLNSVSQNQSLYQRQIRCFSQIIPPTDKSAKDAEEAAKTEAKQFLNDAKTFVDEIHDYSEWATKVMQSDKPVILDCYADWCGPCRKLTPILEELTLNGEGKFKLVKLNIDNLPQLANGLKVQKIPAVFLVHKGSIIDTFTGIPQQKVLEEFVNTAIAVDMLSNDEGVMTDLMKRIEEYITTDQLELAEKLLLEGVSYESWKDKFGAQLYVGIAYTTLFFRKDINKTKATLAAISEPAKKNLSEYYKDLLGKIDAEIDRLNQDAQPNEEELKLAEAIRAKPDDLESRYQLAKIQWEKKKIQEAIDSCLDIVRIERNWNNKLAFNLLIEIFNKVGASNEIVIKARKNLSKILF